jgi:hypothetical protein
MKRLATLAILSILSLFVLAILSTGGLSLTKVPFLSFGDDIKLSGTAFDQKTLDQVSKITELTFPAGTQGLEYAYFGSGIDDSMVAKIRIPAGKKEEFMTNLPFASDDGTAPFPIMGHGQPWWKPDTLTERSAAEKTLPNERPLAVIIGHQGGEVIVYVTWSCT